MHEIVVKPCDGSVGWRVEHASVQPMHFMRGAAAEATARRLVDRLADAGQPACAIILLRNGSLAGRFTRF